MHDNQNVANIPLVQRRVPQELLIALEKQREAECVQLRNDGFDIVVIHSSGFCETGK
jgi:hypothetical protein